MGRELTLAVVRTALCETDTKVRAPLTWRFESPEGTCASVVEWMEDELLERCCHKPVKPAVHQCGKMAYGHIAFNSGGLPRRIANDVQRALRSQFNTSQMLTFIPSTAAWSSAMNALAAMDCVA